MSTTAALRTQRGTALETLKQGFTSNKVEAAEFMTYPTNGKTKYLVSTKLKSGEYYTFKQDEQRKIIIMFDKTKDAHKAECLNF